MISALASASTVLLALLALSAGCVELRGLVDQNAPDDTSPSTPTDNLPGDGPGDDGAQQPLAVTLRVSNATPQVNEQVVLTCTVTSDAADPVAFDFQPAGDRLLVDRFRGTASFVVNESDIGAAFSFTCTATSAAGTSPPSNVQRVVPTPSNIPPP